jgi:23S rRNA (pseudouridine1915-N3)-methyltransferase
MNIRVLCVGKLKEKYWTQACAEYCRRLGAYCRTEIVEVRESRSDDIEEEGELLLRRIRPQDYVITLEIDGEALSSEQLAKAIASLALHGRSDLAFVIGGSNGLAAKVSARADRRLSFSAMTFPHQLMRVILLEQIYRSFKINRHEPYHK